MSRTVECVILKTEAEGLDYAPYPGELGQRIYENVSKEAWQQWLGHQTMLINENRLTPIEPEARQFLATEMEKFFFGGGSGLRMSLSGNNGTVFSFGRFFSFARSSICFRILMTIGSRSGRRRVLVAWTRKIVLKARTISLCANCGSHHRA